jgi:hypothetical protein
MSDALEAVRLCRGPVRLALTNWAIPERDR